MHRITIVSLGDGSRALLTLGALDALRASRRVLLRTGEIEAAQALREAGVTFDTLDALHEQSADFEAFICGAVDAVAREARRGSVAYAVLDALSDETAARLFARFPEQVRFAGGGSQAAALLQSAGASLPARVAAASSLSVPGTQDTLLVVEVNDRLLAGDVKLKLLPWYGENAPALFFPPGRGERTPVRMPLCEIDRQKRYDHTAAVLLPALPLEERERFDLWDVQRLLTRLRGENGDAWDRMQTHWSLSRYLIEEAYEVSAAVEEEDGAHMAEELGDALFSVFFQADIGAQYGDFDLSDITTAIVRKMIRRHMQLFDEGKRGDAAEIARGWERMKQRERGHTTRAAMLRDVSEALPALLQAEKVLRKMADMGLDGRAVWARGTAAEVLCAVEKLRAQGLSAEEETARALRRLVKRVEEAEKLAQMQGKCAETLTSGEINVYLSEEGSTLSHTAASGEPSNIKGGTHHE